MTIHKDKLGWLVAAALAGAMATSALSGFQANTAPKFATVDTGKVFDGSPLAATNTDALRKANQTRAAILEFISQNPSMDPNDAKKFADLSTKATPVPADTTEIARLRTVAEAATQANRAASTKASPDDTTRTTLAGFSSNAAANRNLVQALAGQYDQDIQALRGELRDKTLTRVRDAVRNIAAKQGYTIVFDSNVAPYCANDLTEEASKAVSK